MPKDIHRNVLAVFLALVSSALAIADPPPGALEIATTIDNCLERRFQRDKIKPAPLADDAEFLRRAYLDITGRIPRVADVHAFLADTGKDKRAKLIDQLLEDHRFPVHFANVWRVVLLPEIGPDREAAAFKIGFEAWLRQRFQAGVGYDKLVRELLTVPIAHDGKDVEPVLRDPEKPNPLAFYAVKEARPENLASAVARCFLGVRLECAQCHNHPFGKWKQDQFWSQAAFFAGLERKGKGIFAPLSEAFDRRELAPSEGSTARPAVFLDGATPKWQADVPPRSVLANWVTAPDNPYFARATVNRVWGLFFGSGLVDPVDDFRRDNPPSDERLLDVLARVFVDSDYDLRYLIRCVCLSQAYQRASARTDETQDNTKLPARMRVKALSGEQFFDSLALATGYRDEQDKGAARQQFLTRFAQLGSLAEPETSVQQALTMLNGRFVAWATDPEACPTLVAVTQTPGMNTTERIEALYLATLCRKPGADELARMKQHVAKTEGKGEPERLADVFWMLLNTAEFRSNH
jgi:hypothetical protein